MRARALIGWLVGGAVAATSCSGEPQPVQAPPVGATAAPPPPSVGPPRADECAVLVAIINGGVQHVENEGARAGKEGRSELDAMAKGMDRVAEELERTQLSHDDLLRLGGFYVGVLRLQANTMRELEIALGSGHLQLVAKKQDALAQIAQQEATVVDEVNRLCQAAAPVSPPGTPPPAGTPATGPGASPAPSASQAPAGAPTSSAPAPPPPPRP